MNDAKINDNSQPSDVRKQEYVKVQGKSTEHKHFFFSQEEINTLISSEYKTIISYMETNKNMPYINHEVAKKIFESVVGGNYSSKLMHSEYISEFETYITHVRFTLRRDDKVIERDVVGTAVAKKKKNTDEIANFDDLPKIAMKNAMTKFLSDSIGIGATQLAEAKKEYAKNSNYTSNSSNAPNNNVNGTSNTSNNNGQAQGNSATYSCTDCNAVISDKVYIYSVNYHIQKRALCPTCQKKYTN